jgi:hypothetical protein
MLNRFTAGVHAIFRALGRRSTSRICPRALLSSEAEEDPLEVEARDAFSWNHRCIHRILTQGAQESLERFVRVVESVGWCLPQQFNYLYNYILTCLRNGTSLALELTCRCVEALPAMLLSACLREGDIFAEPHHSPRSAGMLLSLLSLFLSLFFFPTALS